MPPSRFFSFISISFCFSLIFVFAREKNKALIKIIVCGMLFRAMSSEETAKQKAEKILRMSHRRQGA